MCSFAVQSILQDVMNAAVTLWQPLGCDELCLCRHLSNQYSFLEYQIHFSKSVFEYVKVLHNYSYSVTRIPQSERQISLGLTEKTHCVAQYVFLYIISCLMLSVETFIFLLCYGFTRRIYQRYFIPLVLNQSHCSIQFLTCTKYLANMSTFRIL